MAFVTGNVDVARVRAAQDRHRRQRVHRSDRHRTRARLHRATGRRWATTRLDQADRVVADDAGARGMPPTLANYDLVLLPCWGVPPNPTTPPLHQQSAGAPIKQNVVTYTNAGGRVFATHYSYAWLYRQPVFDTTANWNKSRRGQSERSADRHHRSDLPQGRGVRAVAGQRRRRHGGQQPDADPDHGAAPRPRHAGAAVAALDVLRQPRRPSSTTRSTRRSARPRRCSAGACCSATSTSRTAANNQASRSRPSAGPTRR